MTLYSTILASAAGLVRSGLLSQLGWDRTVAPYQTLERTLMRLEQDSLSMQPLFLVPVVGTQDRLEIARLDAAASTDGSTVRDWLHVVYRLEPEGDGVLLAREESLARLEGSGDNPIFRREVLLRMTTGSFAFGKTDAEGRLIWVASWDGARDGVPRLVKFDCTLPAVGAVPPVSLSRVMRNPAGNLPQLEAP